MEEETRCDCVALYTAGINKIKIFIIIFWLGAIITGGFLGPKFFSRTVNTFYPPKNSPAALAEQKFKDYFPEDAKSTEFALFIRSNKNQSLVGDELKNFTFALNQSVYTFTDCDVPESCVLLFEGYYTALEKKLLPSLALGFFSDGNTSTLISITVQISFTDFRAVHFSNFVNDQITKLVKDHDWSADLTGIAAFIPVVQASIERDFTIMDGIALPLAIFVLIFIVKSFRLLLVPLACILTCCATSFTVMYGITFVIDIISFAPSLMMSLILAMSVDYALFLLTRYREELLEGSENYEAVEITLRTAGHTIFVSGVTLAASFLGLVILPLNLMQALGLACAITISIVLLINLTLAPSLLLLFGGFFSQSVEPITCGKYCTFSWGSRESERGKEFEPLINEKRDDVVFIDSPIWFKLGSCASKFPFLILILILVAAALVPFGLYAFHFTTSDSSLMDLPNGSPVTNAYEGIIKDFGYGEIYPYQLLFVPDLNTYKSVLDSKFWSFVNHTVFELAQNLPNTSIYDFDGFVFADGKAMNSTIFGACFIFPLDYCPTLFYAQKLFNSPNSTATYLTINLKFNPLDNGGDVWYRKALELTSKIGAEHNVSITFTGTPADTIDAVDQVLEWFVVMISITGGVVFLFVVISFRSLLLPFRSVVTIGTTLIFVYGFADLVYEHGAFSWLHFFGLQNWGALHWTPPVVCFSVIVGIGLDYDIFLLTRIREYRLSGYSTKEAIALGLSKTGHIITAAGVIMAIAFGGLLFSSIGIITMLSFFMVAAVLFDTFVVRSLVVPAVMGILGDANWWPGKVPKVTKSHSGEPIPKEDENIEKALESEEEKQ